jgi:hypothetical protein
MGRPDREDRVTEAFDVPIWRSRVAAWWQGTARDLPTAMQRLGVRTAYGLLTASAWLPLLAAYGDNPGPAVAALDEVSRVVALQRAEPFGHGLWRGSYKGMANGDPSDTALIEARCEQAEERLATGNYPKRVRR